ncbi:ROK family protein [Gluconacetobacter takamatsuzukensis]|uniref:ROK family protein n=1 Tax=Gluconacetobacter takamatsuzukensis TaxID=1286190 RepID=A0A7W4KE23_9PROT|nr:ROK family protein [Gluconacetobacter takamatsuzukensis]MBB2205217.1 ROK family protein [Gluconacetobacter takamatsuzukensis]
MILCADIGGSFIDFAVVHPDGRTDHRRAVPTPLDDAPAFIGALVALCAPWPGVPLHIAIAGVECPDTGIIRAANIPCLQSLPLAAHLQRETGRVVRIANDADCFALAEAHFGVAKGHRNVFGVILGTGIGGGFVLDGRIVPGLGGVTGEWGHAPVVIPPPALHGQDADSTQSLVPLFRCGCGISGCLDTIAGARALERLHLWAGGAPQTSRAILESWQAGDPQAGRTLAIWLSYMAAGLAHVINVTGSTIVPVAGGLSNAHALIDALDEAVRARILTPTATPLLRRAALGADAGLLGAACLGLDIRIQD